MRLEDLCGILLAALVPLTGCATNTDAPPANPGVAVDVAGLALPGVTDADYTLTVRNGGGEVVTTVSLTSRGYGSGDGSVAYVAPCDADDNDNSVTLELAALYEGDPPTAIAQASYVNPGPLTRDFTCRPDADVPVTFDMTIARRATQGFFDVAVQLSDFFCSAKADCVDQDGQALRLVFGPDGTRWPTTVVALACTSGDSGVPIAVYLTDPTVTCASGTATLAVAEGPGNLYGATSPAPAPVAQAMAFPTLGTLPGESGALPWLQLAVAVALLPDAVGPCTLETHLTVVDAGASLPLVLGGTTHPVIDVSVPLLDDAELRACDRHALDAGDGVVATRYTDLAVTESFPLREAEVDGAPVVTRAPQCADLVLNGDEEAVDCGGSCPPCPIPVTGVSLPATTTVEVGRQLALAPTLVPADADIQTVTWASDAPGVATVDADGVVTGVAEGTATLTVTTDDGGFTATTALSVVARVPRSYLGASAAIVYNRPACSASCMLGNTCWAGLSLGDLNSATYVDGVSVTSCASVTFAEPIDATAVSVVHISTTSYCGDSCASLCNTSGSGRVYLRRTGDAWSFVGYLPRSTSTLTTTVDGPFGLVDQVLLCRDGGSRDRDNIAVRNVLLWD